MSTTEITYQCPACDSSIDVAVEFVDDTVACPKCSTPFRAEAPSAKPLLHDPDDEPFEAEFEIEKPIYDEGILKQVHPAMVRKHPLLALSLTLLCAGGVGGGITAWAYDLPLLALAGAVMGLLVMTYVAIWWINVLATTLTVTNKRTKLRKGIISKSTTEVQHDDIRNMQIDQSVFGRIFGVGDIAISSSGQDDLEVVAKGIPRPNEIADLVRSLQ